MSEINPADHARTQQNGNASPPRSTEISPTQPPPNNAPHSTPTGRPHILLIVGFVFILVAVAAGAFWLGRSGSVSTRQTQTTIPSPVAEASPTPTQDPTVRWKSYNNAQYGYTIKYPPTFKTQVLSAGAGVKEAPPNARNLYIYDPKDEEAYLNRYINLEVLGLEPTYGNSWEKIEVSLADKVATKLVNTSEANDFIVYLVPLDNAQGILEIYVSSTQSKEALSSQILSTFEFTNE